MTIRISDYADYNFCLRTHNLSKEKIKRTSNNFLEKIDSKK